MINNEPDGPYLFCFNNEAWETHKPFEAGELVYVHGDAARIVSVNEREKFIEYELWDTNSLRFFGQDEQAGVTP